MSVESLLIDIRDSVVFVVGELDLVSKELFGERCAQAAGDVVIVDLSGLSFIDASGIGAMVALEQRLGDEGRLLVLRHPRTFVRRVFAITGLSRLLEQTASEHATT